MDIIPEVGDAIKRVNSTNKDFFAIKSEKLRGSAFEEHIEACLDALDVINEGDFGDTSYLDFTVTDKEGKDLSRITIAGLGVDDNENKRLIVSVNLKQPKSGASFLFITYAPTDEGNELRQWAFNNRGLSTADGKEIFTTALTNAVAASTNSYLTRQISTEKH